MQRVVVTGATGYLGSHITKQLLMKNLQVIGTTRSAIKAERLKQALDMSGNKQLTLIECDMIKDPSCFEKVIRDSKP
jgi:short-subunit dehydrogenase